MRKSKLIGQAYDNDPDKSVNAFLDDPDNLQKKVKFFEELKSGFES